MKRYFYYLLLINMLNSVFMQVPSTLIEERFEGAVLAILIGVLIGFLFLFVFIVSIQKFPGLGIDEILKVIPSWFRLGFLGFFMVMWFLGGAASLLAFNNVAIRFMNPEQPGWNMIFVFVVTICLILFYLKSDKILYTFEIVLVLNIPLVLIIMYQAYTNDYLTLPSILEVSTHVFEMPSLSALAASTFIFSGYANMVVFNRIIKDKFKFKNLWFIPIIGFLNLLTSFFIPIGIWGADGVADLTFPWISTADALSMKYGPIERLITIFILLYVSISIISVILHWHVALEITRDLIVALKGSEVKKVWEGVILGGYIIIILWMEHQFREEDIFKFGKLWLNIRLPSEAFLVLVMFFLARRKKV